MDNKELETLILNLPDEERIYVYIGTYIESQSNSDFRVDRTQCEFYTPAYNLYRELKTREEIKVDLYKEQLFELENIVIKKQFATTLESNKYFNLLREKYFLLKPDDSEKPFVKVYKPTSDEN